MVVVGLEGIHKQVNELSVGIFIYSRKLTVFNRLMRMTFSDSLAVTKECYGLAVNYYSGTVPRFKDFCNQT